LTKYPCNPVKESLSTEDVGNLENDNVRYLIYRKIDWYISCYF
jgi:hypothetical protein